MKINPEMLMYCVPWIEKCCLSLAPTNSLGVSKLFHTAWFIQKKCDRQWHYITLYTGINKKKDFQIWYKLYSVLDCIALHFQVIGRTNLLFNLMWVKNFSTQWLPLNSPSLGRSGIHWNLYSSFNLVYFLYLYLYQKLKISCQFTT